MAATRATGKRRPITRAKPRPAAKKPTRRPTPVPTVGRLWFLDVPFQARVPGAHWDPVRKVHVHAGPVLPEHLQPFQSQPYSWRRWMEDDANGSPGAPPAQVAAMEPRPLQIDGARAILAAATSRPGGAPGRGFLLTDDTGNGKTLTAWLGVLAVAQHRRARSVLVLVDRPKAITIPHWRRTITAAGDGELRILICSPDDLPHLIARNGRPRWAFDILVADEAHLYRNADTARVQRFRKVSRFAADHADAPFIIFTTATPGNHPAEMTYLSPLLAQIHREPVTVWDDFGARLAAAGMPVTRGSYGKWVWNERAAENPAMQAAATRHVRGWLAKATPPFTLYRPAPWGPTPLDLMPVQLGADERAAYETAWAEFQHAINALAGNRAVRADPTRGAAQGRAAVMRFRQKASMIRAPYTVEWAAATVQGGKQAVISCEFVSTAAEPIADALEAAGTPVARIFGGDRSGRDMEAERLRFQTGKARAVVFTPTTSLSLHANEMLSAGGYASPAAREGVMHNVRYSGLAGRQILGRSHRDHQICPWWLGYAEGTAEETIAQIMVTRLKAAGDAAGADSAALAGIAAALGVSWLPVTALEKDQ